MSNTHATIRDVARRAGLSVASVSRALNGLDNVSSDTRARVVAAADALGYVPHAGARSLSMAKSHSIGVVLPDLHGEFFSEIVRGMDRAANARGYHLLLSNMHADSKLAMQAMRSMRGRVDGLIVMAPQFSAEQLAETLPGSLPAVLVNSPEGTGRFSFRLDNARGVAAMVDHLISTGRRAIVHISGPRDNMDGAERIAAFRAAMARFAPDQPVRILEGDFQESTGERLASEQLASAETVDAIFAANDMMALGVLQALRQSGIAVPDQIAVAGFDDIPLARYLGLTTLRVDMAGVGERAIERLIAEIEGNDEALGDERIVPELVVRASTVPGSSA